MYNGVQDADAQEEADLKRAIAASLAGGGGSAVREEARHDGDDELDSFSEEETEDDSDEEGDADLRRAIAMSLATEDAPRELSRSGVTASSSSGFVAMDRKAMEEERLARLAKRKCSLSFAEPPGKIGRVAGQDAKVVETKGPIPKIVGNGRPTQTAQSRAPAQTSAGKRHQDSASTSPIQFPRGAIRRTWAAHRPRSSDITIAEVLQPSTLNIAVLSAFQWDNAWLFSKLDPLRVNQLWIMSANEPSTQARLRQEAEALGLGSKFRLHFPPMDGQTLNMHSKMMLLFHDTHLRVVVTTANCTPTDWGETGNDWQQGVMENSVFLIDLPRRTNGRPSGDASQPEGAFEHELKVYLRAQKVYAGVLDGLDKFDWSGAVDVRFVHSIAGRHSEPTENPTGLQGLSSAIRSLDLARVSRLTLDYATSSLGALSPALLIQIHAAATGWAPVASSLHSAWLQNAIVDEVRVYFPTAETVAGSTGGRDCGGIITLNSAQFRATSFPKRCLRDHVSTRPGMLSHNKLLFGRGCRRRRTDKTGMTNKEKEVGKDGVGAGADKDRKKKAEDGEREWEDMEAVAWVYVGSANLTAAAWGTVRIMKHGEEVLRIRNWECGVLVPVPEARLENCDWEEGEAGPGPGVPSMDVFEGTVEVPFVYPGREYEGRDPWFFRG